MKRFVLLLLLIPGLAWGQTQVMPIGSLVTLATAQTSAGYTANAVDTSQGFRRAAIYLSGTTGTLNVDLDVSCDGVNYFPTGVAAHENVTSLPALLFIDDPICSYALDVDTCTACSLNAVAIVVGKYQ